MVQAAAGGGPGEMPEEKTGDWGQAGTLGDSVLLMEKGSKVKEEQKEQVLWRYICPHPCRICKHAACQKRAQSQHVKNKQSSASHISFLNSGKLMKAICLFNSTLSNKNTLPWAQIHNKIYPLLHVWYLKNSGNHNISLKATTTALQVTLGNFYVNQRKKSFVFCQRVSFPPQVASYSLHFQIQSINS